MIGASIFEAVGTVWLAKWSSASQNSTQTEYLEIYALFGFMNGFCQTHFLNIQIGIFSFFNDRKLDFVGVGSVQRVDKIPWKVGLFDASRTNGIFRSDTVGKNHESVE